MTKFDAIKTDYAKSLAQFEKVLREKKTDIVRDSAIKRFELTFDLSWKLIKTFLEVNKGVVCNSPKDCFKEAYHNSLIDYDEKWIVITDWHNESVHNYGEDFADRLFEKLPEVLQLFQSLKI